MIKDLVQTIIKQFVAHPDQVRVDSIKQDDVTRLEIHVDKADLGKVIGKSGQTIKAIRLLIYSITPKDKKVMVDVVHK